MAHTVISVRVETKLSPTGMCPVSWAYEKECRFISSPFVEIHASNEVISQYFSLEMPEFIDIPLVMPIEEILVGPETSNEDYNELERLVSNYENLKLSRSKIKTRFKKD